MPARIDLKQTAVAAQKLGLITPQQLARMTDGTVSWRDKAAADRAVEVVTGRAGGPPVGGGIGGMIRGMVAKQLQEAVTHQYNQQNPIASGAEAVREGVPIAGQRIQDLWNKVF
jgi:hypothetical protein